jgi:heat shock protein HtpX
MVLAIVAVILPCALVWWRGRQVVAGLDSPALAELWWAHRRRSVQLFAVCCVALMFLAGRHTLWLGPIQVLLALAAGFAVRRTVLAERWSFVGYLWWLTRLYLYFASFWILALLTPFVVQLAGEAWPLATAIMAALLVGRLLCPIRIMLRVLGAEPMAADRVPGLAEFADQVAARSRVGPPQLYRLPMRGGRWVNALAVPHRRHPGVVFSEPLLELLDPAEVRAVYAHEVAHLEQYDASFLLRVGAVAWALAVLALAVVPGAEWLLGSSSWLPLGWCLLVLLVMSFIRSRHRGRESEGDARALELCGDAEALVTSLTKLHEAGRIPRRLSGKDEARITHPSLARRIRAIRNAASEAEVEPVAVPVTMVAAAVAGEHVVVEEDRISWLQGVPAEVAGDLAAMRARAAATRSQSYKEICELRVEPMSGGRHRLVVKDAAGRSWTVAVAAEGVGDLQRALDAIDSCLAQAPPLTVVDQFANATIMVRLCALLAMLVSLPLAGSGAVALSALPAVVYPRAVFLLASAAGIATGVLVSWLRVSTSGVFEQALLPSLAIAGLAAVVCLVVGWARATRNVVEQSRGLPWLLLAWGSCLAVIWLAAMALAWITGGDHVDVYRLHHVVRHAPSLVALPAAMAVGLLVGAGLVRRVAAGGLLLAAVAALWLGSDGFRAAHVRDLLLPSQTSDGLEQVEPRVLWQHELDARASSLRVSPDGRTVLVGEYLVPSSYDEPLSGPRHSWTVVHEEYGLLATLDEPAFEALVLDESRILVLRAGAAAGSGDRAGSRLGLRALDGGPDPEWQVELPMLSMPRLEVDTRGVRWQLTGMEYALDMSPAFLRLEGRIGSAEVSETRWHLDDGGEVLAWCSVDPATALACGTGFDDSTRPVGHPMLWMLGRPKTSLHLVDTAGVRTLGVTQLSVTCREGAAMDGAALCVAGDGEWSHLWRVPADGGLDHLASLRAGYAVLGGIADGHALLWSAGDDPVLVDLASGWAVRIRLSNQDFSAAMALADRGRIAVARMTEEGSSVAVLEADGE